MFKLLKTMIISFVMLSLVWGQFNDTVPTTHWIYKSIDHLQFAGHLQSLEQATRPYTRGRIISALKKINPLTIKRARTKLEYRRLIDEFQNEIDILESDQNMIATGKFQPAINYNDNLYYNTRFSAGFDLWENFVVKYSAIIDNSLQDDPYYQGYEWRGFMGYQDQIYMAYVNDRMELKFGRDYVDWGYGKKGNLLISDNSRPMDMLSLKVRTKNISFQSLLSQLDKMYNAERYLTALRIEINPLRDLYIGLGQAALYGGENRPVDFTLSNPFSFYSFTQDNDNKSLNALVYFDLAYKLLDDFRIYSELLIDDFQIDRREKTTLEPDEIGYTIGVDAFDLYYNMDGYIEFTKVRNRTYNVPDRRPFEKFLHKNQFIGHSLGTDFESYLLHLDGWINNHYKMGFGLYTLRKGEGTVRGEFTEPWMDEQVTVEKGYVEESPYGIIETTNQAYLSFHYEYNTNFHVDARLGYEWINNVNSVEGDKTSDFYGKVTIWSNLEKILVIE